MSDNIEKPTSMSPRALYELRLILKRECDALQQKEELEAEHEIREYERSIRAATIKSVVAAIQNTTSAYRLETTSACNISSDSYNGILTFKLKFDPRSTKQTTQYQKTLDKISKIRSDARARLDTWYRDGLYLIANKKTVPPFEVEK
jgi:hypothetical protein